MARHRHLRKTPKQRRAAHIAKIRKLRRNKRRKQIFQQKAKPPIATAKKPHKKGLTFATLAAVILIGAVGALLWFWMHRELEVPNYGVSSRVIISGWNIAANDFLTFRPMTLSPIEEMEGIHAEFYIMADINRPGRQEVMLKLERGRRSTQITTVLYVLDPVEHMHIEAGTEIDISPWGFVRNADIVNSQEIRLTQTFGFSQDDVWHVGEHSLAFSVGHPAWYSSVRECMVYGGSFSTTIYVADTTPPTATTLNVTIPMGQVVYPEDFVTDVYDFSPITSIIFEEEPDIFMPGNQEVNIVLEDYFGNQAVYTAILFVQSNTVPPTIYGTRDFTVQVGNPIMFRQGVSAYDAFGRPLRFEVDSSDVDGNTLGEYIVIYYVEDAWGLRTEITQTVTVLAVDPERVIAMAINVLDAILHEGMTQVEEARAIFDWIQRNVSFAAHIGSRTVYEGAYQAMRNRRGNCFVFYASAEMLMTQAGIPNMRITRYGGASDHYWNLINPDELGWHHFDATPLQPIYNRTINRFMFTSSQARSYTETIARNLGTRNFFTYDPDLYPEIVQ